MVANDYSISASYSFVITCYTYADEIKAEEVWVAADFTKNFLTSLRKPKVNIIIQPYYNFIKKR